MWESDRIASWVVFKTTNLIIVNFQAIADSKKFCPGYQIFVSGYWFLFLTCPLVKWYFLRNLNNRRTVKSILLVTKSLGLVEMTFGPARMASCKNDFFAPCSGSKIYWLPPDKENTAWGKCLCSSEFNWLTQSQRLKRYNILLVQ